MDPCSANAVCELSWIRCLADSKSIRKERSVFRSVDFAPNRAPKGRSKIAQGG